MHQHNLKNNPGHLAIADNRKIRYGVSPYAKEQIGLLIRLWRFEYNLQDFLRQMRRDFYEYQLKRKVAKVM